MANVLTLNAPVTPNKFFTIKGDTLGRVWAPIRQVGNASLSLLRALSLSLSLSLSPSLPLSLSLARPPSLPPSLLINEESGGE